MFLNQNSNLFLKNIKKGKTTLATFLYFGYFSSYLQTKKTPLKRGDAMLSELEML